MAIGKREQNFGLFSVDILLIFDLFLSKYLSNDFYLTKVTFFGGDKIMISFVSNLVFCFVECWIDCFIRYTIKRSMIKTSHQEFIILNESMIYFYLIDV